jgi:hypothetical protein
VLSLGLWGRGRNEPTHMVMDQSHRAPFSGGTLRPLAWGPETRSDIVVGAVGAPPLWLLMGRPPERWSAGALASLRRPFTPEMLRMASGLLSGAVPVIGDSVPSLLRRSRGAVRTREGHGSCASFFRCVPSNRDVTFACCDASERLAALQARGSTWRPARPRMHVHQSRASFLYGSL